MNLFKSIGIMSGTSLDGIDLAYVEFTEEDGKWSFQLGPSQSIIYQDSWKNRLKNLMNASALEFVKTHVDYGKYTGELVRKFVNTWQLKPDVIGVHGHTVFHNPKVGFTCQIGDGATIAAISQQIIANDFRSMDVARGGQGAPLVPIGDQLLFHDYQACLNIGGFANISYQKNDRLIAYDVGPANIILNPIALDLGYHFDDKGEIARSGQILSGLLQQLKSIPYYKKSPPKSLGKEWVDKNISPLIAPNMIPKDILRTFIEHISLIISQEMAGIQKGKVLITGGGAFNHFLIEKIKERTDLELVLPSNDIIEMKEAIIFAFLAVLRLQNKTNTIQTVTGARIASISGALHNGR